MSLGLAIAGVLGMTASATAQSPAEQGQQVYVAQKCSMCHAVAGKGNAKGPLDGVAKKFKADDLRQWLVAPAEMSAKHNATRKPVMRDFSKLPAADLDALVAYLQTLGK